LCFVEGKDGESRRFFLVASPPGSSEEKFAYGGTSDEIAAAQRARGDRNREAVYLALAEAGRGMTAAALTEALKARGTTLAQDTVSSHLGAIVEAGRATKDGRGRTTQYRATADSRQERSTANVDQPREDLYAPKT
jgi:DNA-binding transcriptional ArsR family regulator